MVYARENRAFLFRLHGKILFRVIFNVCDIEMYKGKPDENFFADTSCLYRLRGAEEN